MPRKESKLSVSDELENLSSKLIESENKYKKYCEEVALQNEEYKAINEKYSLANEELVEKNDTVIKILNELRWNEAKFRQMFTSSPAGIFYYDNNLIISELNSAFSETLQASYNSLKDLDMNTLKDKSVLACLKDALKGNIGSYTGFYKSTLSGKEIYIKLTTHPIFSREDSSIIVGGTGLSQDLTDWKVAQDKLEENQENLKLTLHSIGESVVVTDLKSNIVNINPVAENILECKAKKTIGKHIDEIFTLFNNKTNKEISSPIDVALKGKIVNRQDYVELHTKKSKIFQIAFNVSPIRKADGEIIGAIMVFQDISERVKIQQKHFESENKFKSLFENSPTGIALIDSDGTIKEVNSVIISLLGSPSVEATKGINVLSFEPLVNVGFSDDFNNCKKTGKNISRLVYYVTKWKKGIYVQYTLSSISESNGAISGVVLNVIDVTAQKVAEEKEKKYIKDLELITKSAMEILEIPLKTDPLQFIGERLQSILGDNTIIINKYSAETKTSSIEYVFLSEERKIEFNKLLNRNLEKLKFNKTPPPVHEFNYTKKLIELDPVDFFVNSCFFPEKESKKIVELQKVNKVYFMGICPENNLLASLIIITYFDEEIEIKEVIETFINQTSLVLQRRLALKNLSEAKQLYSNTLNSISEFIHVSDKNLNVIFANTALKNIYINLGLNSNIEGLSIKEAFPFLTDNTLQNYRKVILNKTPVFSEETNYIQDTIFHTETILTPVIENDEVYRIITSVRDVTKNKLSEFELTILKELNESIIQNMNEGIFMEDSDGIIVMVNPAFCRMFAKERDKLIGKSALSIIPIELQNKVKFAKSNILSFRGQTFEIEFTNNLDSKVTLLHSFVPIYHENKLKNIVSVFTDISSRKAMEYDLISAKERIEESENHLRNILELSNLSMAIIAFDGTIEFINQQAIKTFGYLHEDIPNMDCWWNLAYPDESYRKQTIEQFTSAVNKAIVEKSEIERREYCPTCKDGTVKTIIIFGVIVNGKIFVMFEDISERKNAELELIKSKDKIEESEEKFRSAFQYAAYGIVLVDIDGRFIRVNDSMCKMLGYNEQEFLEKTFSEITYSDDINIGLNYTKELIQGKRKYFWLEKRYLHKNGNIIWGLVSASAIFVKDKGVSYLVVQIQDITEQKRINDALITSESRLQFISRLTSDYIFELDVDESGKTEMTFVSENFNKITGGTINDIKTPERLFKILHPDDANELSRLVKIIISTGSAEELECRSFIKGNEMRWVSISAKAKIDEKTKKVIAVVGTVKDITERKMAEEQIMNALKKAEESDKLKSAFLANMSHELRTPINGIIGFSNLLLKPDNTLEKKEKYVSQINASTSMLLRLIEDIIDIAKIESGSLTIEKSPCKVSDILNELYVHYQLELKARSKEHIQLVYTPFKDLSLTVVTDPFRLRQVLLNLLSNAVKFTSQGKIEYGFTLENNEIIFYVKDTGIGIKQEYLKQIFERFAQLELSLSRKFGGTGLGLTISKNIIELLGGKIWVESEWERGSSFYFKIPADIIPATNEIVENLIFNPFEYQWGKFTILVAEDDDLNYMFIEEMLVDTKIKLVRAKNGLEAIDIIKSNPEIVLVLMDIQMPFMDGYQSTKMILSIKPHLPIIAQTAFALASEKEMSFKAGCIDYISKPIDLEELLLKIKKYLPVKF